MRLGWWWQKRNCPPGFETPVYPVQKPHERWPDGWVVLWVGKWRIELKFCRWRKLPDFNPAVLDDVP